MSKQGCKTLRKMFVFMALFPPLRALPPVPSTADAPRDALSRCPFTPPLRPPSRHPRPDLLLYVPLPLSRFAKRTAVLTSSPRLVVARLRIPLSTPPCSLSSSPPGRSAPERKGGPTTRRARTAGRDRPHRHGHHFNVTLIKSNNQYLPRKKF